MPNHPHRLTEVDQANKLSSAHARREKSIRPAPIADAQAQLQEAGRHLQTILKNNIMMAETPLEVQSAIESAVRSLEVASGRLKSIAAPQPAATPTRGGPTRQQGQFLAFINEYIQRNEAGIAPSHADLQRFFNLTPPSVNSMLIRLEEKGFIRRIPGKARAIEISLPPEAIPPLERPLKF